MFCAVTEMTEETLNILFFNLILGREFVVKNAEVK